MKIFNSIQLNSSGPSCKNCVNFQNDPAFIETSYPGLNVMSSGYASARDQDGFCSYNQLYLSAKDSCDHFAKNKSEIKQKEGRNFQISFESL